MNSCRGSVVISYDGGIATENELRATAKESLGDPTKHVILVTGSDPGRATDKLATDQEFLLAHPNVHVVERSPEALQKKLEDIGAFIENFGDLQAPGRFRKVA